MLNSIRKFSNSIPAKILLGIIVIPFVFWGMGGVFSGGNKNTLVKINKHQITTKDFNNYISKLNINLEAIKDNIENKIIEEILQKMVSTEILKLEVEDLNIKITDINLRNIIKKNKNFIDEENKFSRTKYEKFLLFNNFSKDMYESDLRDKEEQKILFNYISGGTSVPTFLINNTFNNQNKEIMIQVINVEKLYKNTNQILDSEIKIYIEKNKKRFLENFLTFSYSVITPEILISSNDFNDLFFKKIDEIEKEIINEISYQEIIKKYNLQKEYIKELNENNFESIKQIKIKKKLLNKIKNKENINKVNVIDNGNNFLLFKLEKIDQKLPDIENEDFKDKIKSSISNEDKLEFIKNIYKKVNTKKFDKNDFLKIAKNNKIIIKKISIKNNKDNSLLTTESINNLYAKSKNDFLFTFNNDNQLLLTLIDNIYFKKINQDSENLNKYVFETKNILMNNIYLSFDLYLNSKYTIKVNQQTLDRIKNYFK